jgi:hypothetical protein
MTWSTSAGRPKLTEFAFENILNSYLYDETQQVAQTYDACTPDFFVLTTKTKLIYRGQLDDSRPGNGIPLSGNDLRGAIDGVIYNRKNPNQNQVWAVILNGAVEQ